MAGRLQGLLPSGFRHRAGLNQLPEPAANAVQREGNLLCHVLQGVSGLACPQDGAGDGLPLIDRRNFLRLFLFDPLQEFCCGGCHDLAVLLQVGGEMM
jgi:hypothetical protein